MKSVIGREFMEKTKYQHMGPSDQNQGLPQPPLEKPVDPSRRLIDLPAPDGVTVRPIDLTEAIRRRVSLRRFADQPLTLGELSYLLWATQGVKQVTIRPATLRTVPSAGARHPFETYLLVNQVEGLKPGLYRYLAIAHKLVEHNLGEGIAERVLEATLNQRFAVDGAVTFIWSAVAYRSYWRYHERSYRYMHLDAGHVAENLYLAVQAVDAGCCVIGAYDDDALNALLGLDGEDEFVIYLAGVGKQ
ncbi:MAG: SagB/ThcOx family dehydrogenase [Bacillota bacterium]